MERVPDEILEHYESIDEGARITEGLGLLELIRTREILLRHLPERPSRVIDVGGATGVHASWLAALGHEVHVVDLLPRHVEQVRQLSETEGRITAELGDARQLPVPASSCDSVLLFGPLYHLTEREDRLRAWSEARRVVRPGGIVFGAGISRFASLFDGLARGFLFDPRFRVISERDLQEGQHRNPTNEPQWFTTSYFHHPDELRAEAQESGLEVVELVGIEGLAGWLPQLFERWETEDGREAILFSAQAIEAEPALLGLSAHLLVVARAR